VIDRCDTAQTKNQNLDLISGESVVLHDPPIWVYCERALFSSLRLINVVFNLFMVQVPQLARRKSTTIKKGAEVVRWGADTSALAPIRL
jgi:hypothetical protein